MNDRKIISKTGVAIDISMRGEVVNPDMRFWSTLTLLVDDYMDVIFWNLVRKPLFVKRSQADRARFPAF